jgi:hypothetical protein
MLSRTSLYGAVTVALPPLAKMISATSLLDRFTSTAGGGVKFDEHCRCRVEEEAGQARP